MVTAILELLVIGIKVFSDERQRYYDNKIKNLYKKIQNVSDTDFYKKDMEAKVKAERSILLETEELRREYVTEATKK